MQKRSKVLTIRLVKITEQVDGVEDEVLELGEDLSVDHDITSLNWLINAETCENLIVFEEEGVGLSRDLRRRDVAREVLQPLDPGGKDVDIFVQSVGPETVEYLGAEGVEVDGISLVHFDTHDGPEVIEDLEIKEPPLLGRESKLKIKVDVEIHWVGADVIGKVQRETPLRSNSMEVGSSIRQGMGNPDWVQRADTWVGGYDGCEREEITGSEWDIQ